MDVVYAVLDWFVVNGDSLLLALTLLAALTPTPADDNVIDRVKNLFAKVKVGVKK